MDGNTIISLIGILMVPIGYLWLYFSMQKFTSAKNIYSKVSEILEKVKTDKGFQEKIYATGILLGSGLKEGVGLGEGGLEGVDIDKAIGFLIMKGAQKFLGGAIQEEQQKTQQIPQHLKE